MPYTRTPRELEIIKTYSKGYLDQMMGTIPNFTINDLQLERAYNKGFYDSLMSNNQLFTGPTSSQEILNFIEQLDNDSHNEEPFNVGRIVMVINWWLYLALLIGSSIPILAVLLTNYDALEYGIPAWLFGMVLHLIGFLLYCLIFQLLDGGNAFRFLRKAKFIKR